MGFDNAYEAITEEVDDHRWAFGTGFVDPLSGLDVSVPDGVDGGLLGAYCLMLGDDALIMSQRLQLWLTRAPELEEETALANIGLDLLGQARLLLSRAGKADGTDRTEDELAYLRDDHDFLNVQLVEGIDTDFAQLVLRLFVFSTWRLAVFDRLRESRDPVLAAIAAKGVKEITYHRDYAAQWVVRLGDGTDVSRQRISAAVTSLLPGVEELFDTSRTEQRLSAAGVASDPAGARAEFDDVVAQVFRAAGLQRPQVTAGLGAGGRGAGGRVGIHTSQMRPLLAEMQSVAREHRGSTW
jgi:ring-1,2-phenylacetyl-CoA epoxidase subunit PaaC